MTDDLTDDIIWKQGSRMPWFDTRLGHMKKEKNYISDICVIYLICYIYSIYLICILYIYILHIYVRSKVYVI